MTRTTLLALAFAGFASGAAAQPAFQGTWTIEPARSTSKTEPVGSEDRVYLSMRSDAGGRDWSNWGLSVPRAAFSGFPADLAEVRDARFELRRDAGTIFFEGMFRRRTGVGDYRFTPNRDYAAVIQKRSAATIDDRMLFRLTLHDVSRAFMDGMAKAGYPNLTVDNLVKARIHGATPEHVQAMKDVGIRELSFDELVKSRIHGVTPQFVSELKAAGMPALTLAQLIKFRIHNIDADLVNDLRADGYKTLTPEDVVDFAIHGRRWFERRRVKR